MPSFKLDASFKPCGDQVASDRQADSRCKSRQEASSIARRDRVREDIHDGQPDRAGAEADPRTRPQ